MSERIERDFPGHFIASDSCRWFRTTDVGDVRVSSVGEYVPAPSPLLAFRKRTADGFEEIGYGRLYESMAFQLGDAVCECGCGARKVAQWSEIEFAGYNTRADAEAGHEAMVAKWANTERAETTTDA